jgi:acetyltransferase
MLDYLANQAGTAAILLYVEAVTQARKFLSAARAAARMKPVIVVKSGRFEEGARAAASHTGAMAGSDAVYDAAFRRAGMLRVETLEELFAAVETLGMGETPAGDRLAILTNGGGMGVLATDALIGAGGCLAELAPATMAALDRELPPTWSRNNPVDVIGDADADRYRRALAALFADPGVDAVLALNCPSAVASSLDAARAVAELAEKRPRPALFTCWLGAATAEPARRLLAERRIPTYPTPGQAVQAFVEVIRYRQVQRMLMETPPSLPDDFRPDLDRARRPIERAVAAGREWLSEPEAKEVIAAYGIPVVPTLDAASADHAAQRAAELGGPVALKIVSPDITHKSDVGGVALDLDGPAAVREAALRMADRVALARPGARLDGFSVQPMVRRPGAHELIVGLSDDPLFGPVLLFGQGGTATEVVADRALGLPPLNLKLADELIRSTRVSRLLAGHRGQEGARLDDLALALVRLSQLAVDFDEVVELDVNPLLAGAFGVLALDARVRVAPPQRRRAERLAIRPYPSELEEEVALGDGRRLLLRPIRPEDEPSLQATFARLTPEEIRLRFFVPLKTMSHVMAARFTQLDYDREMALVLTERGVAGRTEIYGVARLSADPDNEHGEYAIIVRRDMTGMGLGVYLLRRLIDYARGRGLQRLWGDVLIDNATMRRLCQAMGFVESPVADEPGLVRVTLALTS